MRIVEDGDVIYTSIAPTSALSLTGLINNHRSFDLPMPGIAWCSATQ